jgi:two-component system sensor histidine kinase AgrC
MMVEKVVKTIDTGNPIIDAILNEKKTAADREKIRMDIEVIIPTVLKIEPIDICIIMGNALDNAIEACLKVEEGNREIYFKMLLKDDHLLLTITNSTNGHYILKNGRFQSTKVDPSKHCFGLLNIESVVKKNSGNLSIKYNQSTFTLNALIRNTAPQVQKNK